MFDRVNVIYINYKEYKCLNGNRNQNVSKSGLVSNCVVKSINKK